MIDPKRLDSRARSATLVELPAQALDDALSRLEPSLVETLRELVRTPSQNLPPTGEEQACQLKVADWLRQIDLVPDVYDLCDLPALTGHADYWPGRDYHNRPNVNARLRGVGGGRSLVLSGHIDTVPLDTPVAWTRSPVGEDLVDGRLYGRGAWDMKAGIAMNLGVLRALHLAGIRLKGDLIFESVVDEEFGGVNGTLAGRLRGYLADAAVIGEPTSLRVCPAQRGGRTVHITLRGTGGILSEDAPSARVVDQLNYVLSRVKDFQRHRETTITIDPYFANSKEPFAVWVTNVVTGKWGWTQPMTIPELCQIELYWQAMPHESQDQVEREFHEWWAQTIAARPDLFAIQPVIHLPMRWLPGTSIPSDSPLVGEFSSVIEACGYHSVVEGLDAPSDMYIFQKSFGMPAIMWGPDGGGAHQADEFVDIPSLITGTRILAQFVCHWCGIESAG